MKSLSYILLGSFLLTLCAFRYNSMPNTYGIDIKAIDKSVARINDTLYAGKYEVSNMLYLAFEMSLTDANKTDLLNITAVDTSNWTENFPNNEPFVEMYYRNPTYKDFPVVNISFEAANLFCQWLTDEYNAAPKKMFKKVLFRLPSESEWEMAARSGTATPYPWGDKLIIDYQVMCNYKRIGDEYIKYDSVSKKHILDYKYSIDIKPKANEPIFITAPVISYLENDYGMYNVCGNVAEMVNIKGISCGGGWKSAGGDVTVASRGKYNNLANDLGFRYFMVLIEK